MGLDVYLYHYENLGEAQALEGQYEKESEQIWEQAGNGKKYDEMTEAEKNQAKTLCDKLEAKLNLGKYGEVKNKEQIEIPSRLYPEHYFKVGYFRSSYNEGGFNSVMGNVGLPDLYNIFPEANLEKHQTVPDWKEAQKRCRFALNRFKGFLKSDRAKFRVTFCHHISKVESANKALDIFTKELAGRKETKDELYSFSNKDGDFFLKDPLRVRAVMPGKMGTMFEGVYLIYEAEDNSYDWYFQALEIVNETIEYVLVHSKPGTWVLHWSG
ncbi:hypothetical protein ES703_08205 [subsurface metagenome]